MDSFSHVLYVKHFNLSSYSCQFSLRIFSYIGNLLSCYMRIRYILLRNEEAYERSINLAYPCRYKRTRKEVDVISISVGKEGEETGSKVQTQQNRMATTCLGS